MHIISYLHQTMINLLYLWVLCCQLGKRAVAWQGINITSGHLKSVDVNNDNPLIDIVITVKTSLSILKPCVESLIQHQPDIRFVTQRVIFVDDDSPSDTRAYERALCKQSPQSFICLETNQTHRGYTYAVNIGVNYGTGPKMRTNILGSGTIVLLNSDTIVTHNWLLHLYNGLMGAGPKVMLAGPLTNAGSYQSIPDIKNGSKWNFNPLPPGVDVASVSKEVVKEVVKLKLPPMDIMVLNGFCFMLKRELLGIIGNFDEIHFPKGYGEEVDFSLRAHLAGYKSIVVPNSFVYHVKTASFTTEQRLVYSGKARQYNIEKYGKALLQQHDTDCTKKTDLIALRSALRTYYNHKRASYPNIYAGSILFVLHDLIVAGGVISILQEVLQMHRYGIRAGISLHSKASGGNPLQIVRSMFPDVSEEVWKSIFHLHSGRSHYPMGPGNDFYNFAKNFDVVVATYHKTMIAVERTVSKYPYIMPAYYVQDYEPWFTHGDNVLSPAKSAYNSQQTRYARSTYTAINKTVHLFAKTDWIADMVSKLHKVAVHRVVPSLDHVHYYADAASMRKKMEKVYNESGESEDIFKVIAMIRPKTPKRNPRGTLDVLLKLAYNYPKVVRVELFGSQKQEILECLVELITQQGEAPHRTNALLNSPQVKLLGVISNRDAVADLYRRSDIFIDMSTWQGFGRSGAEAMSCGCIAIMPELGAASELCEGGACLYHNSTEPLKFYDSAVSIITNTTLRREMVAKGLERSSAFTVEAAAASMASSMLTAMLRYRKKHPKTAEEKSTGIKDVSPDGEVDN